ncbi:MAG TPA: DUF2142 domain-containing protein [Alphaproteobacteria bacterium]|nr:DUF2142 domain-containing protein [Alphaproteobacteria bacterium]
MQNESGADGKSPAVSSKSFEKKVILLLSLFAAIRVFIFSAAFPFFNNVDELMHFDLIMKYSDGHVPRKVETISADSAGYITLFYSSAYIRSPADFPDGKFPPPLWTMPKEEIGRILSANITAWQTQKNYEVAQAPLHYVLEAVWWHLGRCLGVPDGRLLYWLRFFNVVLLIALVWLAYATARIVFPENLFIRLAVPALLAFMPQSSFYSLGNDVLSAVCFGITFICLLKWLSSEKSSPQLSAASGLAVAATFLTKITNLPLLAITAVVVLFKVLQSIRNGKAGGVMLDLAIFLGCALPFIFGWMIWCKLNFGDLTGSKPNSDYFGWTVKPFSEWWHHPIFSPAGVWTYLSGQVGTLWQGEFYWWNKPMSLPGSEAVYTILTAALLVVVLPALWPQFSRVTPPQRRALQISMLCFAALLVFFALLSVVYDFNNSYNPSRQHPYFREGRLLLGALIPFLLLIAYGLDRAFSRFGNVAKFSALAVMISLMLACEIVTDWPVFPNPYNWYHLP